MHEKNKMIINILFSAIIVTLEAEQERERGRSEVNIAFGTTFTFWPKQVFYAIASLAIVITVTILDFQVGGH